MSCLKVKVGQPGSRVNSLQLTRNNITSLVIENGGNIHIVGNFFSGNIGIAGTTGAGVNLNITNNILLGAVQLQPSNGGIFEYNISGVYYVSNQNSLSNFRVRNNIFYASSNIAFTSAVVENNVFNTPQENGINGNIQIGDMNSIFEDYPDTSNSYSADSRFAMKTTSAAYTASASGSQVGAFGGSTPYVLSGIPPVPTIYKLEVPASPTSNVLNVLFSTRSNQ